MTAAMSFERPLVAVIGTCDTKLEALAYVKRTIQSSQACDAVLIDIGTYDPYDSSEIDVSNRDVAMAAHGQPPEKTNNRIAAAELMIGGLTSVISRLYHEGRLAGVIGAGGSGNTSICTKAFRDALPIGFPKLMVSTMASGNVSHYVGETDITMMNSVVDVAGMNSILAVILGNAARAITSMAGVGRTLAKNPHAKPAIGVTMFGLTTPCVLAATQRLEELGYDPVIFHANGMGGTAMERLISEGRFAGVLDITTTELADELIGGVLTAGPRRVEAAGINRIPQVVSVGALDMVNFGPRATVPEKFEQRLLHEHNPSITLMRTTPAECQKLGEILGEKVNLASTELTRLILPLRGLSGIDVEDGPFYDPDADRALFHALRTRVQCPILEIDADVNDIKVANAAVDALQELISAAADQIA